MRTDKGNLKSNNPNRGMAIRGSAAARAASAPLVDPSENGKDWGKLSVASATTASSNRCPKGSLPSIARSSNAIIAGLAEEKGGTGRRRSDRRRQEREAAQGATRSWEVNKLIVSNLVALDGFVASANGESRLLLRDLV